MRGGGAIPSTYSPNCACCAQPLSCRAEAGPTGFILETRQIQAKTRHRGRIRLGGRRWSLLGIVPSCTGCHAGSAGEKSECYDQFEAAWKYGLEHRDELVVLKRVVTARIDRFRETVFRDCQLTRGKVGCRSCSGTSGGFDLVSRSSVFERKRATISGGISGVRVPFLLKTRIVATLPGSGELNFTRKWEMAGNNDSKLFACLRKDCDQVFPQKPFR
jgi:hypothetical protein